MKTTEKRQKLGVKLYEHGMKLYHESEAEFKQSGRISQTAEKKRDNGLRLCRVGKILGDGLNWPLYIVEWEAGRI